MSFSALLLCGLAGLAVAYPNGAPTAACGSMFPSGHYVSAQTTQSPYSLTIYAHLDHVDVTLSGTVPFMGFFIQARTVGDSIPLGIFENDALPAGSKVRPCPDDLAENNGVTHADKTSKTSPFTFHWQAPTETDLTQVRFVATVVQDYLTFWVDIESAMIG